MPMNMVLNDACEKNHNLKSVIPFLHISSLRCSLYAMVTVLRSGLVWQVLNDFNLLGKWAII